jgi:single-strand DNA-binding protein
MASRSVNKVILIGHLGRDAETKFTPSGAASTSFSVATSRRWKDKQSDEWKEDTNWTNVIVWQQEKLAEYLLKGKQVYVEGRVQTRSYDGKDGKKVYVTEVVAEQVILLGGHSESHSAGNGGTGQQASRACGATTGAARNKPATAKATVDDPMHITDDDVPSNAE